LPGIFLGDNELPAVGTGREQQMQEVAERIGGALGAAVRRARGASARVRGGLELVQGRAADKAAQVSDEASDAASEFKETAREKIADWNQSARRKVAEARHQAAEIKTAYPLQMMLGLAAAFFVIGFAIRFWRSTHA
jgi:hypothetical protein